ncbi:hypothetical protein EKN06_13870 [Croceicoccus ponticola]|uniref:Zinc ribbon domain-containing protein n=1 Tax=Croceicoccus ponticola TaxID=2217664 RepID=A0A437GV88_9SPHN|nr:hypothetical protein [Croceicoccus ponticola]RVQ65318.1 hypothetical protein EKN06_13870 [Croceicoccus ponticola]
MTPPRKTVYEIGRMHMAMGVASGLFIVWGIPLLASAVGMADGGMLDWVVLPLLLLWVVAFAIRSLKIACPRCGTSIFRRGLWSVFWPARTCSRCGLDLTSAAPRD